VAAASYDAVVVGARCAGSIIAGLLARQGRSVLLVDKATFPSDTVSTHVMFPNTIARFDELGILDRLTDRFAMPWLLARWRILGHEISGSYTPVGGHALATCVRRVALDSVLVDWAKDCGAEIRPGTAVRELVGGATPEDPVRGVVLDGGEEAHARFVIGADGRASTVASLLGLEKTKPMAGEMAYLFAYWRGLPPVETGTIEVSGDRKGLMHNPCEDGIHLLSVAGPPDITRGTHAAREQAFDEGIRAFPETLDPRALDKGERISDLVVVPETMMRGFFRQANGPGWALVGDAGHFKHPGTAQGISDAVEQAVYVAEALDGDGGGLEGYDDWRWSRSKQHYEWSFTYGSWPVPDVAHPYMSGLAGDPAAAQDWLDTFTRVRQPSDVNTPERLNRWFGG
jgi:2-polyprenyl-6-methoxyphenol hydroxylase-like FAD-dependent oxidoreductase